MKSVLKGNISKQIETPSLLNNSFLSIPFNKLPWWANTECFKLKRIRQITWWQLRQTMRISPNCNWPAIINQSHSTNNFCLSTQCLCFLECRKCVSRTQSTGNFPSYFWLVRRWPSPCLLKLSKLYYYRQKVKRVVLNWLSCRKINLIDGPHCM